MAPEYIEISTKVGKLKGLVKKSTGVSETTYYSFQAIPYGKPPVGKLRFQAPEPFGQWKGVRDATKEGSDSCQRHKVLKTPDGSEDCLYLNIYTPQEPGKQPASKAVMAFFHGGGFAKGSACSDACGPDYLVEQDIVLVTITYRCGVLGFLSLENDKVPGNAGLKDQNLALRWVQENIDSFGGDPNNVTIFGHSAGAASVHYHLLSPLSRGLFHKAILQSGFSVSQWAFQTKPKQKAILLAKELGCTSQDPDEVLEFLMSVPAADIVDTQDKEKLTSEKERIHKLALVFLPCVEGSGDAPFLPDLPQKMMKRGEFVSVPIIIGVTDNEGQMVLAAKAVNCDKVNADLSVLVPADLNIIAGSEEEFKLGREILQFYTKKESLTWDVIQGFVDFISDIGFSIGLEFTRQCLLARNSAPVYTYLFTYSSPRNYCTRMLQVAYPDEATKFVESGVGHSDEMMHLFRIDRAQYPFVPPTTSDQSFMNKFLKSWTTFAKTGDPNCKDLGATWNSDNIQNPHFLELGKDIKIVDGVLFPKRLGFWKNIYEKYS